VAAREVGRDEPDVAGRCSRMLSSGLLACEVVMVAGDVGLGAVKVWVRRSLLNLAVFDGNGDDAANVLWASVLALLELSMFVSAATLSVVVGGGCAPSKPAALLRVLKLSEELMALFGEFAVPGEIGELGTAAVGIRLAVAGDVPPQTVCATPGPLPASDEIVIVVSPTNDHDLLDNDGLSLPSLPLLVIGWK